MSSKGLLLLCVQTLLIQNAFSRHLDGYVPGAYYRPGAELSLGGAGLGVGSLDAVGVGGYAPFYGGAAAGASAAAASSAGAGWGGFGGATGAGAGGGQFGGEGEGELKTAGTVTAAGSSAVSGQLPVLGSVSFEGSLPATGKVLLTGNCGCAHLV